VSITAPQPAQPRPQQPQRPPGAAGGGGAYNAQLHPRGRGGLWITTKGDGYGAGGPSQTTQQLQQRLQQLGFHVPADGKYGVQTAAAVKAFQARYGLTSSGGVDAATMALLQNPPPNTLAQVQASKKAATAASRKARSTSLRKSATAKARASATSRTSRVRASAGGRTGAPGVAPGTVTSVVGVGHMGAGNLTQGTGMQGTSNPAVSNLQAALTQAGFTLNKDGRFGPKTEAAVKQLQTKYGLQADGIVGPATKALLLGLESGTPKAAKKVSRSAASKAVPGQPVTLRTQTAHARHGSRTAGSRMKLKGPAPTRATLKYSASDLPDPDLEETTLAFGVGGAPSMSIKDARPAPEPTPIADQPVWDRLQKIADPPSYVIPDGRDIPPPVGVDDTLIDDGRDLDPMLQAALNEAVAARKAATDGRTFARALARERLLRERLQETIGHSVPSAVRSYFDPHDTLPHGVPHAYDAAKHPRGRGGKWAEVLNKLKSLRPNRPAEVHGVQTMRVSTGHYTAALPGGVVRHTSPEPVAHAIDRHAQVAPYFDLSKPHTMVPVGRLDASNKTNPESSNVNAGKRMDTAAAGGMAKRKPLSARRRPDGSLEVTDGHATLEAAKRKGITHVPVDIQELKSGTVPYRPPQRAENRGPYDGSGLRRSQAKHQALVDSVRASIGGKR
jgi:peptidoglycan hydrolase-like protein with peptidoglycan-binding domain